MMKTQLTPKDWQQLSEYLDGQLSERDQAKLEQRLNKQPDLQTALDEMRQMRSVLRAVPHRKVPHNFTLTHAMVAEQQQRSNPFSRWIPALSISSALATLILVVTMLIGGVPSLTSSQPVALAPSTQQALEAPQAAEQAADQNATKPPVILWNGTNGLPNDGGQIATGRGGGGGSGQELGPQLTGPQAPLNSASEPPAGSKLAPETTPLPNDTPAAPEAAPQLLAPQPTQTAEAPQALAQAPSNPAPADEGSGPILGVAPKDKQGQISTEQPNAAALVQPSPAAGAEQVQTNRFSALLAGEFGLALIAIAAAIGAILLRIRSRS